MSEPRVIELTTTTERIDTFRIEGGEVRPVQYSRGGRMYRVDMVQMTTRDNGAGPVITYCLRGQVLKKDGTDSLNRTDETFWSYDPTPEWVTNLATERTEP